LVILRSVSFLQSDSQNDWTVTLVDTGDKSLKGSRLKKIEKYIHSDSFMVTYGDGLCDVNIE
jgi:glucose-1-phosphate cytidylyltransferase